MVKSKILIVDDQYGVRTLLALALKKYHIKEARNGHQAIEIAKMWVPDLIIIDYKMPDLNGLDTITKIYSYNLNPHVLLMTAYNDVIYSQENIPISGIINKPFDLNDLLEKVNNIINEKPGVIN